VRGKVGLYASGVTVLVGLSASLAVLDVERDAPGATITTFPDALWWTLTTITTVGYGDRYPVSVEGRMVAAALMIGGIALLGVITGFVASWFVEKIEGEQTSIDVVRQELAEMRALLEQQRRD